jgi:hypothetical protein
MYLISSKDYLSIISASRSIGYSIYSPSSDAGRYLRILRPEPRLACCSGLGILFLIDFKGAGGAGFFNLEEDGGGNDFLTTIGYYCS